MYWLLKPPASDRRKAMLHDIAVLTGGTLITEDIGRKLDSVEPSDLGRARRVTCDKDHTTIVEGKGESKDIQDRIKQLKVQIDETDSEFDKEKLQERMARLAGGVAVIKVGAATETEMKEKKHRVEDALAATKAAVEEGILPGGGVSLLNSLKAWTIWMSPVMKRPCQHHQEAVESDSPDCHERRQRRRP